MNIYQIAAGDYTAKINLSRGANCISLRNSKYHASILREPDYSAPLDNPYLYGMPVLFPVNRISGGRFFFEGREYCFPVNEEATGCHVHGTMHEQEFSYVSGGSDYVVCAYKATQEKPYLQFPHEFEIRIGYYLSEKGLRHTTEIENLSDKNMPVMLGYHTTFQLPFVENQSLGDLRVYADVADYIERDGNNYLPTGIVKTEDEVTRKLKDGTFLPGGQKISRHYKSGNLGVMCIHDIKTGLKMTYENSEKMKYRLIYNGNADEFICLEPQNCMVDCANAKGNSPEYMGFMHIEPFETVKFKAHISIAI